MDDQIQALIVLCYDYFPEIYNKLTKHLKPSLWAGNKIDQIIEKSTSRKKKIPNLQEELDGLRKEIDKLWDALPTILSLVKKKSLWRILGSSKQWVI